MTTTHPQLTTAPIIPATATSRNITKATSSSKPIPCDVKLATGRRRGRVCGSPATHFDSARKYNVCGVHVADVLGALPGTGTPWYADVQIGCDTPSHEGRETRRTLDGVRMCMMCSFEREMRDLRCARGAA